MKRILLLMLAFASINSYGQNSSYTYITTGNDGEYYLYNETVSVSKHAAFKDVKSIEFWVKKAPEKGKEEAARQDIIKALKKRNLKYEGYEKYSYKKTKWAIDCYSNKFKLMHVVDYDEKGNVLDDFGSDENNPWEECVPESIAEEIKKFICDKY